MEKELRSVLRTSRFIWWGVILQGCLFTFWGVNLFLTAEEETQVSFWPYVIFTLLGIVSLVYGFKFYQNYTRYRQKEIMQADFKKRKEMLLLAAVMHFSLLEFVCILGVLLAVFLQKKTVVYPFFIASMIGLAYSFPQKEWFAPFLKEDNEPS